MLWVIGAAAVVAVVLASVAVFLHLLLMSAVSALSDQIAALSVQILNAEGAQGQKTAHEIASLASSVSALNERLNRIFPPPTKSQQEAQDWAAFTARADSRRKSTGSVDGD